MGVILMYCDANVRCEAQTAIHQQMLNWLISSAFCQTFIGGFHLQSGNVVVLGNNS